LFSQNARLDQKREGDDRSRGGVAVDEILYVALDFEKKKRDQVRYLGDRRRGLLACV